MRRRLPPLNSLRAFEALGRHGKLADAADELCVTVGAVSRHIGIMEEFVGVKLFMRHARGLTLTDNGALYLQSVGQMFDQLDCATARIIGHPDRQKLSVHVFTAFATEWLMPRLPGFISQHPEIELRLTSSVRSNDVEGHDVDIAIRRGPIGPDMDADALYRAEYFPVCSPALLEREPGLCTPCDLSRFPLLTTVQQAPNWRRWLESSGASGLTADNTLWHDNASLAYQAARNGVGLALGQRHYLVEDFIERKLLAPFSHAIRSRSPFYMIFAKRHARAPPYSGFSRMDTAAHLRNRKA